MNPQKLIRPLVFLAIIVLFIAAIYIWIMPGDDIMTASLKGDTARVKALLQRHPELAQTTTFHGYTPLHWAAMDNHYEMAESLIQAGTDVDALSEEKVTPLYLAALRGHAKIVHLLLDNKADPDIAADYIGACHCGINSSNSYAGCTPLYVAVENGHADVVRLLIAHGADSKKAVASDTILCRAATAGYPAVVDIIIKSGADLNAKDKYGNTPLMRSNSADITAQLLRAGADPNITDSPGSTVMHEAARSQKSAIVRLLLR